MTAAAGNGRPGPAAAPADGELRLLIREVLAGLMARSGPGSAPAPAARPDAPPTAIPDGVIASADPPAAAPARPAFPAAAPARPALRPAARGPAAPAPPAPRPAAPAPVAPAPAAPRPATGNGRGVRPVRLQTDEDVRQFVLDILRLADNPARRADLISGRLSFTLAGSAAAAGPRPGHRVDKGAVTERAVQAAARAGQRLVLGPRAMLTPLARDRALALGVPIDKER